MADATTVLSTPSARHRPNIRDVARQARVSPATISNYLNHKGRMSEATRQRIEEAIAALHFTPNALVRAIRERRTNILGVLTFGLDWLDAEGMPGPTPALLAGIHESADAADSDLLLYTGWWRHSPQGPGLRLLDGHIDGLIWVTPRSDDPDFAHVVAAGLPVVSLLARGVPEGVGYVDADNLSAMERLVAHLIERGHRRIAYVGPDEFTNFLDRRAGVQQVLETHELWDPLLMAVVKPGVPDAAVCTQILENWLRLPSPPTAVMCATDLYAKVFAQLAQTRGLRIPHDLALTGFDDSPIARHIAGGLTTVRQPFREMGKIAAASLLAMIAGEPADAHRHTLPTELVIRNSTGGIETMTGNTPTPTPPDS